MEEVKLERLVRELCGLGVSFQGFSINGGANRTLLEMQNIYRSMNAEVFFEFRDLIIPLESGQEFEEIRARTVGEGITQTLSSLIHPFPGSAPAPQAPPFRRRGLDG
jgi:hypothetical protein